MQLDPLSTQNTEFSLQKSSCACGSEWCLLLKVLCGCQVITWHMMFSREVRLREALKRIMSAMWQAGVSPNATGYTATDIIIALESGE